MRKFLFVLIALLLAAPSMADVVLTCTVGTVVGVDDDEVTVHYDASGETELPRAFALDITVSDGVIDTLVDHNDMFWVHPGSIVIDGNAVTVEGEPIAVQDGNYPDREEGGLGTDGITIEMGSLYDPNDASYQDAPPAIGTLLTFTVDTTVASTVTIAGNAARGDVVLEDASQPTVDYGTGCVVLVEVPTCYDGQPDFATWEAVSSPSCWCFPKQCHGDADGLDQGGGKVPVVSVSTGDLDVLAAYWQIPEPPDGSGVIGTPGICADFDHISQGGGKVPVVRVSTGDLDVLAINWQIPEPPDGSGVPADCLD